MPSSMIPASGNERIPLEPAGCLRFFLVISSGKGMEVTGKILRHPIRNTVCMFSVAFQPDPIRVNE